MTLLSKLSLRSTVAMPARRCMARSFARRLLAFAVAVLLCISASDAVRADGATGVVAGSEATVTVPSSEPPSAVAPAASPEPAAAPVLPRARPLATTRTVNPAYKAVSDRRVSKKRRKAVVRHRTWEAREPANRDMIEQHERARRLASNRQRPFWNCNGSRCAPLIIYGVGF